MSPATDAEKEIGRLREENARLREGRLAEQEREKLIVKMARVIGAMSCWHRDTPEIVARAALAAAEPVIREECARIADEHSAEVKVSEFATATNALCAQKMAKDIAASIRKGGYDE